MIESVNYDEIKELKINEVIEKLNSHKKTFLEDLKVKHLVIDRHGNPLIHGVYLFYNRNNECLYCGKNSANSYVDRIPSHFAPGSGAWFNQFIKGVCKYERKLDINKLDEKHSIASIVDSAFKHYILLLPAPGRVIKLLERTLIVYLKPKYNSFKTLKPNPEFEHLPLRELIGRKG